MSQSSAELRKETSKALRFIAAVMPPREVNIDEETPKGKQTVGIYTLVLFEAGVSPEAVLRGAKTFIKSDCERFFPAPGLLITYCRRAQEEIDREAFQRLYSDAVTFEGDNGVLCIAPRSRVRAGRLLPEGDFSGDGSLAPAALPKPEPQTKEEKSKRAKAQALARSLVGNPRGENVRRGGLQRMASGE